LKRKEAKLIPYPGSYTRFFSNSSLEDLFAGVAPLALSKNFNTSFQQRNI